MKKLLLNLLITGALLWIPPENNSLIAQGMTVPDYSYGSVYASSGSTVWGVTSPGPYGKSSQGEDERPSGLFFVHGFRWWGYPSAPLLICGDFPIFNFPGFHGIWDNTALGCSNPSDSYMASMGSVIAEPASRQIWCLTGAITRNGPTAPYCIPNPFGPGQICYPAPSIWGYGTSYGYMRKVVVVQSTGSLQHGDPVNINASLTVQGTYEGDWVASSKGVLFLNKMSGNNWFGGESERDYLRWGTVEDIIGTPNLMNNMLGNLIVDLNNTDDTTATVAIGDTIIVEVAFNNSIQHANPGGITAEEGWAGERPIILFNTIEYTRTDNVRNLIKEHGNRLAYDLTCLTPGAILEPVTPDGPNLDEDNDGISDAREKGADGTDSDFDGNNDGTPDCEQANVASFLTYDAQNYVTLVVPPGTELSQLIVTGNPSPLDAPENADFPYGFFDFSIDGLAPGESIIVTLILHDGTTADTYYKYGMTPDDPTPHWYEFLYDGQTGAQINGNIITLHFTDGLRGDEDITVNSSIKEPGGPSESVITDIPFLEEPGIIKVYPNPVTDYFNVEVPEDFSFPAEISVHNAAGILLQKQIMTDRHLLLFTINKDWKPGLYFIIIRNGLKQKTSKMLIVR